MSRPDRRKRSAGASYPRSSSLRGRLSVLEAAVAEISKCRSIEAAARAAGGLALGRIGTQAACVYLLNSHGVLARIAIIGKDAKGSPIPRDWFREEHHQPGRSITGRVLPENFQSTRTAAATVNQSQQNFGSLSIWERGSWGNLDKESLGRYQSLLGDLENAAGVPLNGPHRSFGVLEVLNKLEKSGRRPVPFDEEDIYWLWHISTVLSARISFLRRKAELALLASVASELSEPYSEGFNEVDSCQRIVDLLVSSSTCFRAAIFRLLSTRGELRLVARSGRVNWDCWQDEVSSRTTSIIWDSLHSNEIVVESEIPVKISRFVNKKWLLSNKFQTYVCLPLRVVGEPLGTVALFTSFVYIPDEDDSEFLENVQAVASGLANASRVVHKLESAQEELETLHLDQVAQARQVSYVTAIEEELHRFKNDFQQIAGALEPIASGAKSSRKAIQVALDAEIENAELRIAEITSKIRGGGFQAFQLSFLVQELVQQFRQRFNRSAIFELNLDSSLPLIEASEAEFREIVSNLLVNAVSAVKAAERPGVIRVTTGLQAERGGEVLVLEVEDNGVGIPREAMSRIFERDFTTRAGGTGMGLFIAKRIVQKYIGEIQVESSVGRGTIFRVSIPRETWEYSDD